MVYVATTGNDISGAGTQGSPYLTLAGGMQHASASDVVEMAAGTYDGVLNYGQTVLADLTVRGASGATVILDGENANFIMAIGSGRTVSIDNIEFKNGNGPAKGGALILSGDADVTVTNCKVFSVS